MINISSLKIIKNDCIDIREDMTLSKPPIYSVCVANHIKAVSYREVTLINPWIYVTINNSFQEVYCIEKEIGNQRDERIFSYVLVGNQSKSN